MISELKSLCLRLNITCNEEVLPFYEKGVELKEKLGMYIFNKDRLIAINDRYQIFRAHFPEVMEAVDAVVQDEDLVVHTYMLLVMMMNGADITRLELPDRKRMDTDFAPLFAVLYFLEDMIGDMEQRGVPYRIISDTMNGFETEMNDYYDTYGRYGVRRYVNWFMHWVKKEILRVGRFQFEFKILRDKIRVYQKGDDIKILMDGEYMHVKGMVFGAVGQENENQRYFAKLTETDGKVTGYATNTFGECVPEKVTLEGYTERLRCGDKILGVHIISHEPFTRELCDASYEQVVEVMKNCYPEFKYKAICCHSWMMEKRLREIMGRDTNITRFAERYHVFPTKSKGTGVYSFLYHLPPQSAGNVPENLPEDNSMQRAVKAYLKKGNHFYEKGGCFFVS